MRLKSSQIKIALDRERHKLEELRQAMRTTEQHCARLQRALHNVRRAELEAERKALTDQLIKQLSPTELEHLRRVGKRKAAIARQHAEYAKRLKGAVE